MPTIVPPVKLQNSLWKVDASIHVLLDIIKMVKLVPLVNKNVRLVLMGINVPLVKELPN